MFKMKKIYAVVCVAACLLFAGCFEVEEKTSFSTAESGDYAVTIDMGKMIGQLKMMGGTDKLNALNQRDSITYLKDVLDKDSSLSKEEKSAVREGFIKMKFNEEQEEMKIVLAAPFKSIAQLRLLRGALFKLVASKTRPGMEGVTALPGGAGLMDLLDLSNLGFTLKADKGSISNTVDAELLKHNLESDSTIQQIKQFAPLMGSSVVYKSVYSFPTPIKDFKAAKGTISDDKKTIIVRNDFNDLFDNPAAFEYSISY